MKMMAQLNHPQNNSLENPDNQDDACSEKSELDPELDERLRRRRKNPLGF